MCHFIELADKIPDANPKPKPIPKPTRSKKPKIRERDIVGLKYFDQLAPLLERPHHEGCQRDTAGNRKPYYDQDCMLILLFMFNQVVAAGSSYVCRLRDNSKWEVQEMVSQPQGTEIGELLGDEIVSVLGVNRQWWENTVKLVKQPRLF